MVWDRRWFGAGLIGASSWLLTGCASDLPDWAQSNRSLSADISAPAIPRVRMQIADSPPATLQKPLTPPIEPMPPPGVSLQLPERPAGFGVDAPKTPVITAPPPDFGTQQASLSTQGTVRVRVRAWVNSRPIFEEEVMQTVSPLLRSLGGVPESQRSEKMAELMNSVIDQIVDQEVMYQDAVKKLEKASPSSLGKMRDFVDAEFDRSLLKMRQAGVPEAQIREIEPTARRMLERNLISTEYARSRILPVVTSIVNMTQIRDYYEAHLSEFRTVDKVVWQDIFIPVNPNQPTVEDVQRFAEDLINKCRTPEDFDRLMAYNEGDSKLRGGEGIGTRLSFKDANGKLVEGDIRPAELDEHLARLREGEIGPVVPFSTGVHLIRVTKREFAGQLPLNDTVQKTIRKTLENQLADREFRRIVRELRTRSVVRVERE